MTLFRFAQNQLKWALQALSRSQYLAIQNSQLQDLFNLAEMEQQLEEHQEMCTTTYKELVPYVVEFVRILEKVFEAGKAKGEEAMMAEYLMRLMDCTDNEDN